MHPRLAALIALLIWLPLATSAAEVTDQDVREAIQTLQQKLLNTQQANGTWGATSSAVGMTALCTQALLHSGISPDHPAMVKALAFLQNNTDESVYSEGLIPATLSLADPRKYRRRIERAVHFLTLSQQPGGNWGYGMDKARGDNSNTQFAVLGLVAAEEAGVQIPEATRRAAIDHWLKSQNGNGGWGYSGSSSPTLSMTCAGIASLNLLGVELVVKDRCCGDNAYRRELVQGLKWLGNALRGNSAQILANNSHPMYALYALERVGIALGVKEIGGVDWYRWGANAIINERRLGNGAVQHAFALLFLARGSAPVAVAKWQWKGDWNNQHYDVRSWAEYASRDLERKLDFVDAPLTRLDSPAAKASLIFINGTQPFTLQPGEAEFLRAFLDNDGTLVAEPTCGSTAFYDSFRSEILTKLCPDYGASFIPLDPNHPVLRSHYQLVPEEVGGFEFRAGCKQYRIILLTRPISCALNGDRDQQADLPRARRVAVNLLAWAMQGKSAERKLDELELAASTSQTLTLDQIERRASRGGQRYAHPLARLRHNGQWLAAPGFLQQLRTTLEEHPGLPRFDGEIFVAATDADLFDAAVLFMNGYDYPTLGEPQVVSLRGYLQNGGFLLANAACSNPQFDQGFRDLMRQVLPNDKLEPIPADDPLWQNAFNLFAGPPEATRAYTSVYQNRWAPLFGIRREGRWIVVYSPVDLCSDLTEPLGDSIIGYRKNSAFQLVANILKGAMTP